MHAQALRWIKDGAHATRHFLSMGTDSELLVPLPSGRLFRPADLSKLAFQTTRDLVPVSLLTAHRRADEAIRFGMGVSARGFNIFASGPSMARLPSALRRLLTEMPSEGKALADWVYVNNFAEPHRPASLALPPGRGVPLQRSMRKLIEDLRATLPALFESEDYQRRRSAIDESFRGKTQAVFEALSKKAASVGVAIVRTPMGFTVTPLDKGEIVDPDVFSKWPVAKKEEVRQAIAKIEAEMEQSLQAIPRLQKERGEAVRALDNETANFAIGQEIDELRRLFSDLPQLIEYLEAVRADLTQHVQLFLAQPEGGSQERLDAMQLGHPLERYDINVIVSNKSDGPSPVVEELNPTIGNLLGRVEHVSFQGALITNFRMIKAGALHRANGGTIIIDAGSLLTEPFAWPALKRVLTRQEIVIEDLAHIVGFASTAMLEPQPIPLRLKVVLFGERWIYYALARLDPEFRKHFKVLADFEDELDRSPESEALMARLLGGIAKDADLRPLNRSGVEATLERVARLTDDAAKLSLLVEHIQDLITEADRVAAEANHELIRREDIESAIAAQRHRAARLEEHSRDMILRNLAMIASDGTRIGQVNGLSVIDLAGHSFGHPSRITARVAPGGGKIVDIEREVELGGPLHSKGVLILSGFIAGRYAQDVPMSLQASLVFEQSYGGVEGDSASVAELCALLSALASIPLRQDIGVTGSVNQHGDVQPIGGVNEKIEGFFDICAARGLTGRQGVLIPDSNVQQLMLRQDVVRACADGKFSVYPMRNVDEALSLLTNMKAGERNSDGHYPPGCVNAAVVERLAKFAAARKALAASQGR